MSESASPATCGESLRDILFAFANEEYTSYEAMKKIDALFAVSEIAESEPLTCTDAREQQMGCFRAVKAERELAEAGREIVRLHEEWGRETSPSATPCSGWIKCSERVPEIVEEGGHTVIGWFPGSRYPAEYSRRTVRAWALDPDPIDGALWMPMPEVPRE